MFTVASNNYELACKHSLEPLYCIDHGQEYICNVLFRVQVVLCRPDVVASWAAYLVQVTKYGALVEAEPPAIIGYVEGLCLVDPQGEMLGVRGVESLLDDNYQLTSYAYPQMSTPVQSLEGATSAVAAALHETWGVHGYLQVSFVSYWDSYDGMPKLWALRLKFGLGPAFGGIGTLSVAMQDRGVPRGVRPSSPWAPSLLPRIPEGDGLTLVCLVCGLDVVSHKFVFGQ